MSTTTQKAKLIQGGFTPSYQIDRIPEICISVRISQVETLLQNLLPGLTVSNFRIIWITDKPGLIHFLSNPPRENRINTAFIIKPIGLLAEMNAGMLGPQAVGKFVTIYPNTNDHAIELTNILVNLTKSLEGPPIQNYYPINPCVFWKERPPKKLAVSKISKKKLIGTNIGGFIPTALIREAPKGDIYKGVGFKSFRLREVCIKEGRPWLLEDVHGRDIRDRMLWQKEVLKEIESVIPTAKVLKLLEKNRVTFLILEYIEGELLPVKLDRLRNKLPWPEIPKATKMEMLGYYLQILLMVEKIHELGYVHRDLQDNNFHVKPDGQVVLFDFEMAYSVKKAYPPYPLGTFGYASPNQLNGNTPNVQDDLFSLGALLYLFLTGIHPSALINQFEINMKNLDGIKDQRLCTLVRQSLSAPDLRPSLPALKEGIQLSIDHLSI
jgi:serine/threonine protein kinase